MIFYVRALARYRAIYFLSNIGLLCPPPGNYIFLPMMSLKAKDKNTGEETPIEEAPAEGELTKVENYRAPGGSGAEYVIDRTLDKILQELLVQNTEDENAEDVNDSLTDDDGDETIDQTEGVRGLIMEAAGAATTGDVSAAADLPSHWRGTFVPLSREQVEALKVERGQEAVTEYLEKRCSS